MTIFIGAWGLLLALCSARNDFWVLLRVTMRCWGSNPLHTLNSWTFSSACYEHSRSRNSCWIIDESLGK